MLCVSLSLWHHTPWIPNSVWALWKKTLLTLWWDAIVFPEMTFFFFFLRCPMRKVNYVIFRLWFTAKLFKRGCTRPGFWAITQRNAGRSSGDNHQSGAEVANVMGKPCRPTSSVSVSNLPSPPDTLLRESRGCNSWVITITLPGYEQRFFKVDLTQRNTVVFWF